MNIIDQNADKETIIEYIRENDAQIASLDVSGRLKNVLRMNGIVCLSELAALPDESLTAMRFMTEESLNEIRFFMEDYLESNAAAIEAAAEAEAAIPEIWPVAPAEAEPAEIGPEEDSADAGIPQLINELLETDDGKRQLGDALKALSIDANIKDLKLSVRSSNCLCRAKRFTVSSTLELYPDGFAGLRNMGRKSEEEVKTALEKYLTIHGDVITEFLLNGTVPPHLCEDAAETPESDEMPTIIPEEIESLTLSGILGNALYTALLKESFTANPVPIENMNLSARAYGRLHGKGITDAADLMKIFPDGLQKIPGLGATSVTEINSKLEEVLKKRLAFIAAGPSENNESPKPYYSDDYIRDHVLAAFKNAGFSGLNFTEMRSFCPDEIEDSRVKTAIASLIKDNRLEYVDFRCYRVYPSFFDYLDSEPKDGKEEEKLDIVREKLSGKTLEEIGTKYGVTRERIRQKLEKACRLIRNRNRAAIGTALFSEDFYTGLYENYDTDKEFWLDYVHLSERTYNYLKNLYTAGKSETVNALSDENIPVSLRIKVEAYLNRQKIRLGTDLIDGSRVSAEKYVLSHYCTDELTFEDFCSLYNSVLKNSGILENSRLYLYGEVKQTRLNRLSESHNCLWKHGSRLRYYDVDGGDYSELLETLNLEAYENTEVSTLKFINDFPELMQKYDIRDRYELHNLLRKIISNGDYHDISMKRQPIILFGEFDREKAILDAMLDLAPVSTEDLLEYLYLEYGYDKETMTGTVKSKLGVYYDNGAGIFRADFKRPSEKRLSKLSEHLPRDFYYTNEIKEIYTELFPDADPQEINVHTVKSLGFKTYSGYAVRNYPSVEEYFRSLLTGDDKIKLKYLSSRYSRIQAFYGELLELRKKREVFVFENNSMLINIRKLEAGGVGREDIDSYCKAVAEIAPDGEFFTVYSLRKQGFESPLDDLGFDESFYAGILNTSGLLSWQQMFGTTVFYKGSIDSITRKTFILQLLERFDSISPEELMDICREEYGIVLKDRYLITEAVEDSHFYYDRIMNKIYADKNAYYDEIDY